MKIIVCENYDEMSLRGAEIVKEQVNSKPDCILGLATGSTPVGLYTCLAEMNKKGDVDFSKVTSFNLDEYYPISPENDQSYRYFMNQNLFSKINIDIAKTHVPNGMAEDPEKACREYDESILAAGGIDLQILGIGQNGHIAFNEPDDELYEGTHLTSLTESTIKANARFFEKEEDVPTKAVTMGIASIMRAKKIIILANGPAKREIVEKLINGGITTNIPASILKVHPDVTLICDSDACPEM
ncbi:MAG: glucosamine-6-phosphate deaminase [Clostridia bacterium]|nr:glucosamine-6-phosphate deaminase [Clostridia bacterium]